MKTFDFLSLFFIFLFFFMGCIKEYANPTISWEGPTEKTVNFNIQGDNVINLEIKVKAESGIDDFRAWKLTYKEGGVVPIPESISVGEDWRDLEMYNYKFEQIVKESDFDGNVTNIEFKFEVKDKKSKWGNKIFNVTTELTTYSVTFNVIDEMDDEIQGAVITLNGIENSAGNYVFTVEAGTYNYSVVKSGYIDATGIIDVTEDVTKTVVLSQ